MESATDSRLTVVRSGVVDRSVPCAPLVVVVGVAVGSLLHSGVGVGEILRYSVYWCIAVVLPGLAVARLLIGARPTLVEDAAIAAVTGVSLEVLLWALGAASPLGAGVRFWWAPVLLTVIVVGPLRRRVSLRPPERLRSAQSWALCAVSVVLLLQFDARFFRSAPLPPTAGVVYQDHWWQLGLVQEMMRYTPPQIPQLAGEPFAYHYLANAHIGSASRLSGVVPEVALLRLWIVPVGLMLIGLAVVLGRLISSSLTAGIVAAGVAYAVWVESYLWYGMPSIATAFGNPITFHSPSQTLSCSGLLAAAIGVALLIRRRTWGLVVWLIVVVAAASGEKSTVVPILLAATGVTLLRATYVRSPAVRPLAVLMLVLVLAEVVVLRVLAGTSGGVVVLLGSLSLLPVYRHGAGDSALRGVNEGLLLDSLDSPKAGLYALLAATVLIGVHAVRWIGVLALAHRPARGDLMTWWLSGAVLSGLGVFFVLDHVGASQIFFPAAGGQLGAILTVSVMWRAVERAGTSVGALMRTGVSAGCLVMLVIIFAVVTRRRAGGYGLVDRVVWPVIVGALAGSLVVYWWWKVNRWRGDRFLALVLAAALGVLGPTLVQQTLQFGYRLFRPVAYASDNQSPDWRTEDELAAMLWLRSASEPSDVLATNVHCRPAPTEANCDSRAFWVTGLSGRRAFIESWGFTDEAQSSQGIGGLPYQRQPTPFPERSELNAAVFLRSDEAALDTIVAEFGVEWLVAVHAAGPVPAFPDDVATVRYENDDVTIFEVAVP